MTILYIYDFTKVCITILNGFCYFIRCSDITCTINIYKIFTSSKISSRIKFQNGKITVVTTTPIEFMINPKYKTGLLESLILSNGFFELSNLLLELFIRNLIRLSFNLVRKKFEVGKTFQYYIGLPDSYYSEIKQINSSSSKSIKLFRVNQLEN